MILFQSCLIAFLWSSSYSFKLLLLIIRFLNRESTIPWKKTDLPLRNVEHIFCYIFYLPGSCISRLLQINIFTFNVRLLLIIFIQNTIIISKGMPQLKFICNVTTAIFINNILRSKIQKQRQNMLTKSFLRSFISHSNLTSFERNGSTCTILRHKFQKLICKNYDF